MNIFSRKAFYIALKGVACAMFSSLRGLNVSWRKLSSKINNGPVLIEALGLFPIISCAMYDKDDHGLKLGQLFQA